MMYSGNVQSNQADRDAVASAAYLIGRLEHQPRVAIILGSGLGSLADEIRQGARIPYAEIPGWARTTAAGHGGELVVGDWNGQPILAMSGRFHRYEGWSAAEITRPVRTLAAMGVGALFVSNAAGAVNPQYRVGDIVVIHDHIDWMHGHPSRRFVLAQPQVALPGGCPHRRGSPYDGDLCRVALAAARKGNFMAYPGTYLATLGPSYETRAEYRMMRRIGADVVGMSTVPEVLEAQRLGIRVLALSMVSNVASPDTTKPTDHAQVLDAGQTAQPRLRAIVSAAVKSLC